MTIDYLSHYQDESQRLARDAALEKKSRKMASERLDKEADVQKNLAENVMFLMEQNGLTQDRLAELLLTSPTMVNNLLHKNWSPRVFPVLMALRTLFGCSTDDLLYTDIRKTYESKTGGVHAYLPVTDEMNIAHIYQGYYFDTSRFRGRENAPDGDSIKSCVLYIKKEENTSAMRVVGIFNLRREEADMIYREAEKISGAQNIFNHIASRQSRHIYYGTAEVSRDNIYIGLDYQNVRDRVRMVFHMPSGNSRSYIGGLGCMVTVTKGGRSDPCVQCIALSEKSLNTADEEIAEHLKMHYPKIKNYEASEELALMLKGLYPEEEDAAAPLSDEQKLMLVRYHLETVVNETVERNLFRTVKVSDLDDSDFYHYLKRANRNSL